VDNLRRFDGRKFTLKVTVMGNSVLQTVLILADLICCAAAPPETGFSNLEKEYDHQVEVWAETHNKAESPAELIARYELFPLWNFFPRMLDLAVNAKTADESFAALGWVIEQGRSVGVDDRRSAVADNRALELLLHHHRTNTEIGPVCLVVAQYDSPAREAFLRAICEQPANTEARALSTFGLAKVLIQRRNRHFSKKMMPKDESPVSTYFERQRDLAYVELMQAADTGKLYIEAETLLERVQNEYAEQAYRYPATGKLSGSSLEQNLGNLAERALFELRNLSPERPIPDADGKDLDGRPFSLADHRGKVMVLTFWYSSCAPCLRAMKEERQIFDRFHTRPLVLLGVNTDKDVELARQTAAKHEATWPSLWDGDEKLAKRWNITGWPTTYVVDHRGQIVAQSDPRMPSFAALIERLVEDAERSAR